ncbi:MAG: TIM barrel protein [Eubacteriales bacterium]|nr:TIM barrel protein [Eubacteriales bacterium]
MSILLSAFADEAAQDLEGQIAALIANRVPGIELRTVDSINVADFDSTMTARVKTALDQASLKVNCLATPLGKVQIDSPLAPELERLKRLSQTAHALDCQRLRIFSFYVPAGRSAEYRDEVMLRLERLIEVADAEGVRLFHENEKDIYGDVLERCVDIHQTFQNKLGAILDPANYVQVGSDPLQAFKDLDSWIEYLHIKDCRHTDGHIVAAGQGDGQIAEILKLFLAKPGRQSIAIEPHLFEFASLKTLEIHMMGDPGSGQDVGVGGDYPDALTAFAAGISAFRTLAAQQNQVL